MAIIEKILKQLTSDKINKEIEVVRKIKIPSGIKKWIKEYEKTGERDEFIWKWLYNMFQVVHLPDVPKKYQESLLELKILLTIFIVQLDDVADKGKNFNLLNELLKIPAQQDCIKYDNLNNTEKKYLFFTKNLWSYIEKKIQKYPNYQKCKTFFNYDVDQVLNAMKYSYLVNQNPYLINKTEYWMYLSYNMTFFVYSDFDLMCCSYFDFKKMGALREIISKAQKMARIGNWVSTWEREIEDNDFTSGVFAQAVHLGVLSADELKRKNKANIIHKIKKAKIEKNLLYEWEKYYFEIKKIGKKMPIIDVNKFLYSFEKLIILHLTSKGYK